MPPARVVDHRLEPAECVEQVAVRIRVDQRTVVVLAVDLDEVTGRLAQQRDAGGLVVDEDAAAPVGRLHAPEDHVALILDGVFAQERARRVIGRHVESRDHLPLLRAMTHQRGVATRTERQRQRIEQDRLAGARFTGQNGKPVAKLDVQPLDQDDISDREVCEHVAPWDRPTDACPR